MKKWILTALLLLATTANAQLVCLQEEDGSPGTGETCVWNIKVSNGGLTNNFDGSASIDTAAGGHSNGANCNAGEFPLGVDASGAAESCTDATTEIDSAISTHTAISTAHHTKTVSGDIDHDSITGVSTSDHHVKYTDAEAVTAVSTADDYLKNDASDTTTGTLTATGGFSTSGAYTGTYTHTNTPIVMLNLTENETFSSNPAGTTMGTFNRNITGGGGTVSTNQGAFSGSITMSGAGATFASDSKVVGFQGSIANNSSTGHFTNASALKGNIQSVFAGGITNGISIEAGLNLVNGGNITTYSGLKMTGTVDSGETVTTYNGLDLGVVAGAGTLTTYNGINMVDAGAGVVTYNGIKINTQSASGTIRAIDVVSDPVNLGGTVTIGGDVGIGQSSPTARLHIAAGTTSANTAPLKFTEQASALTSVEPGTMEYVGHSLQFSQYLKRRGIVMSEDVRTSTTTVQNTVTESGALATVQHGTDYLEVGKSEETVLIGTFEQRSNPSAYITFRVKYAGSTIHTLVTPISTSIAAGTPYRLTITTTYRSIGATGTVQINSVLHIAGQTDVGGSSLPTIDTTSAQDTTLTAQWGEAHASNILKVEQGRTVCIEQNK